MFPSRVSFSCEIKTLLWAAFAKGRFTIGRCARTITLHLIILNGLIAIICCIFEHFYSPLMKMIINTPTERHHRSCILFSFLYNEIVGLRCSLYAAVSVSVGSTYSNWFFCSFFFSLSLFSLMTLHFRCKWINDSSFFFSFYWIFIVCLYSWYRLQKV